MTSLRNKLFYTVRPMIPRRVVIAARKIWARRIRNANADIWPIDDRCQTVAPGWPGWPDNKRFALVLTHDVEGPTGLSRVRRLMDLEAKYGFHSSFNFVPEGAYRVSPEVLDAVHNAGFEAGVHGLTHDGKLYFSKSKFASKAARIKKYVTEWRASGFRSPFMQHDLAALHGIGVEYDSSTFDTDPFEPEPDGVGTMFPFWVPGPNGNGYVELPYTLCQDFTLLIILGETTTDIWKRKLDWIAERGGMALLNTHPDYMDFDGGGSKSEYPASLYEDFLRYARERYGAQFWHALPRDVSRYYTAKVPQCARASRKKICMVTHSVYEKDNRVRRYAEALARRGDLVDVISIAGKEESLGNGRVNGVSVQRLQRRTHEERGKWTYVLPVLRFLASSSARLTRMHADTRYDLVHVHNIPDFMVFAALYPKLNGAKVILDIHDLVPELFASKFRDSTRTAYVGLLKLVEKASARFANHVIIANDLWLEAVSSRSAPASKCSVYVNHVDRALFYRRERTRTDDRFVILFHGTFQWHQGLDIAIRALPAVKARVPNVELHLYGGGGGARSWPELQELAASVGIGDSVRFFGAVPLDEIPQIVANADLGIVPKRADSFGNEAYSTKIMEFMSQGVPVVVSRTKIDSFYFDDQTVRFFASGDSAAMAEAMLDVMENPGIRKSLIAAGLNYVERNSWDSKEREYLTLVDSLTTEVFDDLRH